MAMTITVVCRGSVAGQTLLRLASLAQHRLLRIDVPDAVDREKKQS